LAGLIPGRHDAHTALLAFGDQRRKALGAPGVDLKKRFGVENADGADISLCDFALTAYFGQQPFGIGVSFPAHIQPEPDAIFH